MQSSAEDQGQSFWDTLPIVATACRACSSRTLVELFCLGEQYPSNFVARDKVRVGCKVPVTLDMCQECSLIQARYSVPGELLYSGHYWYRSGVTQTMRDALGDVTKAIEERVLLSPGDVVLDIGSNDGTLLRTWTKEGLIRVGCEPADNLATPKNYEGLDLIHDFWSFNAWEQWHHNYTSNCDYGGEAEYECPPRRAKVITALGMFYDLEDPNPFIADVAKVLAPDGTFVAQLMCAKQMFEKLDIGNLAHEHLEFYTLASLEALLNRHGLTIVDVEENDVNGGSYRLWIHHSEGIVKTPRRVMAFNIETEMRLEEVTVWRAWFERAKKNLERCAQFCWDQVAKGREVWVYGASTKGNVILQMMFPNGCPIKMAADRSPEKWGRFTVGTGIEIVSEEAMFALHPDHLLVLPYAFFPEIERRLAKWHDFGGRFILPLPEFKVV